MTAIVSFLYTSYGTCREGELEYAYLRVPAPGLPGASSKSPASTPVTSLLNATPNTSVPLSVVAAAGSCLVMDSTDGGGSDTVTVRVAGTADLPEADEHSYVTV